MTTIKFFEVRDAGTTVPVVCLRLAAEGDAERWLLRRAGYAMEAIRERLEDGVSPYIIYWPLIGGVATYDPFGHPGGARTHKVAHMHIRDHWLELASGDVVDVEFILGERAEPKVSERLTAPRY